MAPGATATIAATVSNDSTNAGVDWSCSPADLAELLVRLTLQWREHDITALRWRLRDDYSHIHEQSFSCSIGDH